WRMLFHLYGAKVENWEIVPEGVIAHGFSVFGNVDPNQVIKDISGRTRRLDLITTFPWMNGQAPAPYADASEITADTVQFYKGAVEEGSAKTPGYVKTAVASYKSANSLAKKR